MVARFAQRLAPSPRATEGSYTPPSRARCERALPELATWAEQNLSPSAEDAVAAG
jgi:hypothetical protein